MVCPKCNIDTKTDTRDGRTVLVCRNPQCSLFKQIVLEIKEVKQDGKEG